MNRYIEWPKVANKRGLSDFSYIKRERQHKELLKQLRKRNYCYIRGFWASGKTRFLENAVDALADRYAEENALQAVLISVSLNAVRENASRNHSELNSKWWYLELCKAIDTEIKKAISVAELDYVKQLFDDIRKSSAYNNISYEALKTYLNAAIGDYMKQRSSDEASPEIHLILAIENIDVLFELESSFEEGSFSDFTLNFLKVIHQAYRNKNNSDRDYANYNLFSIILTGSYSLEELDAAAYNDGNGNNLAKGLLKSAFKSDNLSLSHFSIDELKETNSAPLTQEETFDNLERIFSVTNGHPVLTIDAMQTLRLPIWERVDERLIQNWKEDLRHED